MRITAAAHDHTETAWPNIVGEARKRISGSWRKNQVCSGKKEELDHSKNYQNMIVGRMKEK